MGIFYKKRNYRRKIRQIKGANNSKCPNVPHSWFPPCSHLVSTATSSFSRVTWLSCEMPIHIRSYNKNALMQLPDSSSLVKLQKSWWQSGQAYVQYGLYIYIAQLKLAMNLDLSNLTPGFLEFKSSIDYTLRSFASNPRHLELNM